MSPSEAALRSRHHPAPPHVIPGASCSHPHRQVRRWRCHERRDSRGATDGLGTGGVSLCPSPQKNAKSLLSSVLPSLSPVTSPPNPPTNTRAESLNLAGFGMWGAAGWHVHLTLEHRGRAVCGSADAQAFSSKYRTCIFSSLRFSEWHLLALACCVIRTQYTIRTTDKMCIIQLFTLAVRLPVNRGLPEDKFRWHQSYAGIFKCRGGQRP